MINILELKIVNKNGDELLYQKGESIKAEYFSTYNEGDKIVLKTKMCDFVEVKFDETMPESIVFVPGSGFEFEIPFGGLMAGYSPEAFSGEKHIISAKEAD